MKPDDFKSETFSEAYDAALKTVPESHRAEIFVTTLTRNLIHCLTLEKNEEALQNPKLATTKIQAALTAVQEDKGIEFVLSSKIALKAAFEHQLASRMTYSDMPPSVKESGLYKFDFSGGSIPKEG
jgi:hypothetical protein